MPFKDDVAVFSHGNYKVRFLLTGSDVSLGIMYFGGVLLSLA